MPGIIRVSVLEAIDLPEVLTDGTTVKGVTAKVTLGPRLFKTQPGVADGGRIETWNSDFAFPVMNLRDKLVVSICDSEDHSVTQTAIEIPSIIQKGSRDEFVPLNKGGRIHLRMSFVLTDEERNKIESMRIAALKRREEVERLKKTVAFQPVQESLKKELKKYAVSTVAIADVDVLTTYDKKSKEPPIRPFGLDSTPKPPAPKPISEQVPKPSPNPTPKSTLKPMFNYGKAIGFNSGLESTERRSNRFVTDNLINDVMASNGDVNSALQMVRGVGEVDSSGITKLDFSSAASPGSRNRTCSLVTKSIDSIPPSNLTSPGVPDSSTNEVKANNAENAENAENAGELALPDNAQLHVSLVSPTSSDGRLTKPTNSTPLAENLSNEVEANNRNWNSEAVTVRESAENAGLSGASVLNISIVDASPISGLKAASLATTSIDRTSKAPGLPSGISSSLPNTLKTVKALVKRTFSKGSPMRSSRRASSSTVVARIQSPVPVVWLQNWFRKALSNVKGCFSAPA